MKNLGKDFQGKAHLFQTIHQYFGLVLHKYSLFPIFSHIFAYLYAYSYTSCRASARLNVAVLISKRSTAFIHTSNPGKKHLLRADKSASSQTPVSTTAGIYPVKLFFSDRKSFFFTKKAPFNSFLLSLRCETKSRDNKTRDKSQLILPSFHHPPIGRSAADSRSFLTPQTAREYVFLEIRQNSDDEFAGIAHERVPAHQ